MPSKRCFCNLRTRWLTFPSSPRSCCSSLLDTTMLLLSPGGQPMAAAPSSPSCHPQSQVIPWIPCLGAVYQPWNLNKMNTGTCAVPRRRIPFTAGREHHQKHQALLLSARALHCWHSGFCQPGGPKSKSSPSFSDQHMRKALESQRAGTDGHSLLQKLLLAGCPSGLEVAAAFWPFGKKRQVLGSGMRQPQEPNCQF